ncbi:LacI family transcriptional regulator [Sphingobacterium allocomposti]|uniref:LacI family transcriptional regulator n=1 Tax=Sphingobacterium allocomposti TaxID=415956 RepID=A0A5S5D0Y2_9SPHI|nr:LacI family DNA-binding transcriptional regulator [Sphingobacterium composti Yoo et al. 2007 non Ten et al. 2007]TYP88289.1 LacI family transcriptional regulator [Sphingobacterium composti Yoo et al. 2007 non Ten et al. 2007]
MGRTTLKSLAQALNMSVSTVSKALNDSYEISEATKKRVREFAKKHNYQPNVLAQSLKTGKTQTLGVVLPKMTSPFESQILEGMQQTASQHHYRIVIMNSMEDEELEKQALQSMLDKAVDGILFCPIHESSNIELAGKIMEDTPIVIFDRTNYALETHKIGVLNAEGTYSACKHLLDIGRKRIAVFCGARQGISAIRLSGYERAHQEFDIPIDTEYIVHCNVSSISELHIDMERHIERLLSLPFPPDAIVGVADTITTHLLGVLAKMGVAVPETLAVIGFANTDLAFSLNPSLSTIRQPTRDIGEISVNKLVEVINKRHRNQIAWEDIKLPTSIQFRRSTVGKA